MRVLGSTERMAIHQTKRQTDLEKRLEILRRQVYGKSPDRSDQIRASFDQKISRPDNSTLLYAGTPTSSDTPTRLPSGQVLSDLTYLRHDLLKILTFSSIAIGSQIIFFILLQNHFLRINIF